MILFVTEYKYPGGDAGSLRIHSIAKAFKLLGLDSKIIGYGMSPKAEGIYEGFQYISLRGANRLLSRITLPFRIYNKAKAEIHKSNPSHLFASNLSAISLICIKLLCKRYSIKLIYDVVEWYSPSQFKLPYLNPVYLEKQIVNRFLIDKSINVISISRYLHNYFSSKGIKSVRVPVFFSQSDYKERNLSFDKIQITYAGTPGKKDFLWLMLKSFEHLDDSTLSKLNFNIVGCSNLQVNEICNSYGIDFDRINKHIIIYGRVPHDSVLEILNKSHFTFLLRDATQRYAKAGFPTKVVESVSNSVPVVLNYSSDLELYFKDNHNCILIPDLSVDSISKSLIRITKLSPEEYLSLSHHANDTAISCFNTDSYIAELKAITQ